MTKSALPDYDVLTSKPIEKEGEQKSHYTRVGAGWKVKKKGISIMLDAMPLDGKLVLFPRTEPQGTKNRVSEEEAPY